MTKVLAQLARLHKATEESFLKYGHIYFFMPIAFDHYHNIYGQIVAGVTATLASGALAYRFAAWAFENTDG